jgi:hypothetical protein
MWAYRNTGPPLTGPTRFAEDLRAVNRELLREWFRTAILPPLAVGLTLATPALLGQPRISMVMAPLLLPLPALVLALRYWSQTDHQADTELPPGRVESRWRAIRRYAAWIGAVLGLTLGSGLYFLAWLMPPLFGFMCVQMILWGSGRLFDGLTPWHWVWEADGVRRIERIGDQAVRRTTAIGEHGFHGPLSEAAWSFCLVPDALGRGVFARRVGIVIALDPRNLGFPHPPPRLIVGGYTDGAVKAWIEQLVDSPARFDPELPDRKPFCHWRVRPRGYFPPLYRGEPTPAMLHQLALAQSQRGGPSMMGERPTPVRSRKRHRRTTRQSSPAERRGRHSSSSSTREAWFVVPKSASERRLSAEMPPSRL